MFRVVNCRRAKRARNSCFLIALALCFVNLAALAPFGFAQTQTPENPSAAPQNQPLTVRRIMAEPSLAGMRVEGKSVSPDGRFVAYLWSATGREPRDLYVVSTDGATPARLLARAVETATSSNNISNNKQKDGDAAARTDASTDAKRETQIMQRDPTNQQAATNQQTVTNQQAATHQSITTTQGTTPRQQQEGRAASVGAPEWSPDSKRILYAKSGDLYVVSIEGSDATLLLPPPRRLTNTAAVEAGARWLDDSRVLYQSNNQLFAFNTRDAALVQLTREIVGQASNQANAAQSVTANSNTISGVTASDDGGRVAYILSDTSKQRALIVPNYTGEFVTAQTFRRGWTEQKLFVVSTDGSSEKPFEIKLPAPEGASYIRGVRWDGSRSLVIDRIDKDTKRRQLYLAGLIGNEADLRNTSILIDEEIDDKWIASLSRFVEPVPKGGGVSFASERDGFNHLYVTNINADKIAARRQITRGNYEVSWAAWLPDGERVVYSSTETGTAERSLFIINTRTNQKAKLNLPRGMNTEPQLSKNGATLIFEHSEALTPTDLYAINLNQPNTVAKRLTDTVPSGFKSYDWSAPQFVSFTAKDGKSVAARMYLPKDFDKQTAKKYPLVVFVHGAGYLQNAINGWNNYYREAMFHTLLNQRG